MNAPERLPGLAAEAPALALPYAVAPVKPGRFGVCGRCESAPADHLVGHRMPMCDFCYGDLRVYS